MAGFVVPYMAVYDPALMLQPVAGKEGLTYALAVAYIVGKALLAICLWGAGTIGYLRRDLALWERVVAFAAAAMLVLALPITDEVGFLLAAVFIGQHWWRARAAERAAAA